MKKAGSIASFRKRATKKRPGVHAKSGTSKCKNSKNYKKKNIGQGK